MSHIIALGIVLLVFALALAQTWRRYRRSPRTPLAKRLLIANLVGYGLLFLAIAGPWALYGKRVPLWMTAVGVVGLLLAAIAVAMMGTRSETGQERRSES
jgi:hypothetical protein